MIHYLQFPFTFELDDIIPEIESMSVSYWKEHYNTGNYMGEWSVIPIISLGGNNTIIAHHHTISDKPEYKPTDFLNNSPALQKLLSFFQFPIESARLMKLTAGAMIKEHTDYELSYEEGTVRLHVPIFTNDDVDFRLEGERIPMQKGECWYLNFSLKHSVVNNGDSDRIHLVIDGEVNEWVRNQFENPDIITKKIVEQKKNEYDIVTKKNMIIHLRELGNETALQMALQLEQEIMNHDITS